MRSRGDEHAIRRHVQASPGSAGKTATEQRRHLDERQQVHADHAPGDRRCVPRRCERDGELGEAEVELYDNEIVIATILRAGLPFHQGFLNYFDDAQNAFVSAYRKSKKDGTFTVKVEYISCGSLEGKTMLLVDPLGIISPIRPTEPKEFSLHTGRQD